MVYYTNDYEHAIIHPATERWLIANGYSYEHEYDLYGPYREQTAIPGTRMADFVAWKHGQERLIVECKTRASKLPTAFRQLAENALWYHDAVKVAILPKYENSTHLECLCAQLEILLVGIEVPITESEYKSVLLARSNVAVQS